jgi:two-component system, OmpR family, sensor histidine kinase CpxA
MQGPPPGRGPPIVPERMGPEIPPEPQMMFSLRTSEPTRYWVAVRFPPPEPRSEIRRPMPLVLFVVTDSLYSGTLFLDVRLWIFAALGTLLLSVLLWIPPVRALTRSLSELTRATDAIANGDFSVRVQVRRSDEVGHLGWSVNRMADRLDGFVKGQKRFLGDIAHELCSPLARLQVGLGILEQSAGFSQKPSLEDVRDEVEEMSGLVNELLSFSKASLDRADSPLESVPLAETVQRVLERENVLGPDVRVSVENTLLALGRTDLISRALANLVRNAKRYAGEAGPIEVAAEAIHDRIRLTVTDQGNGVPEPELQRIFDPFYRAEPSRSRETGGAGLGLAIVKSCVEACGGSVQAKNLEPQGFQVMMLLKRAEKR